MQDENKPKCATPCCRITNDENLQTVKVQMNYFMEEKSIQGYYIQAPLPAQEAPKQ